MEIGEERLKQIRTIAKLDYPHAISPATCGETVELLDEIIRLREELERVSRMRLRNAMAEALGQE